MNRRGFTLIELLVVIAIIGILASMVLASLGTSRSKARDATRKSDLAQIRTALEQYSNDSGGTYPVPADIAGMNNGGAGSGTTRAESWTNNPAAGSPSVSDTTGVLELQTKGYLTVVPVPPKPNARYGYVTNMAGCTMFNGGAKVASIVGLLWDPPIPGVPSTIDCGAANAGVLANTEYTLETLLEAPATAKHAAWQVNSKGVSAELTDVSNYPVGVAGS